MTVTIPHNPAKDDLLAGRPTQWLNPALKYNGIADPIQRLRSTQAAEAVANWPGATSAAAQ